MKEMVIIVEVSGKSFDDMDKIYFYHDWLRWFWI
jgi:hypothetical protein